MKKLLNKKIIISVLLIILVLVIVALYRIGFRITYAPELENSWEAVSAVATCVGVFASFIAIWYAIQVPNKIAEEQNKIALFEKRYKCFQFFERCIVFYKSIKDENETEKLQSACYYMIGEFLTENINLPVVCIKIKEFEYILHQMEFLFPELNEDDVSNLYMTLQSFIISVIMKQSDIEIKKKRYINAIDVFINKYTDIIWNHIDIYRH